MNGAGLFDLQVNGFAGIDFQRDDLNPALLDHAAASLRSHGTGKILLTLITDDLDVLCRRLENARKAIAGSEIAREVVAGFHLEGPWLSSLPGFHGAHDPAKMRRPSVADFTRLESAAGGMLRLVTLAPELPGSAEVIARAVSRNVRVSIGHSDASESEIDVAIEAGLTLCTHLGNGVPILMHRHDNIIQRLLGRDELTAVFIPDGIHLPPHVLRNLVRSKPREKVLFTSDCMSAAGAGPGSYRFGKMELAVGEDGVVRESGKETFAGSSLTMDQAVENVMAFAGWSAADAIAACSTRVAAALGLDP